MSMDEFAVMSGLKSNFCKVSLTRIPKVGMTLGFHSELVKDSFINRVIWVCHYFDYKLYHGGQAFLF